MDSFQRSERKLHRLAAAESRGHLSEDLVENTHRTPARQTLLPQLLYDISLIHIPWFDISSTITCATGFNLHRQCHFQTMPFITREPGPYAIAGELPQRHSQNNQ